MFLRFNRRFKDGNFKDGKERRCWNIVESKRCAGGKVVQRQVLYLGEINDSQHGCRQIEAFDEGARHHTQVVFLSISRSPSTLRRTWHHEQRKVVKCVSDYFLGTKFVRPECDTNQLDMSASRGRSLFRENLAGDARPQSARCPEVLIAAPMFEFMLRRKGVA